MMGEGLGDWFYEVVVVGLVLVELLVMWVMVNDIMLVSTSLPKLPLSLEAAGADVYGGAGRL